MSTQDLKECKVGKNSFSINKMGARKSVRVLVKLAKLVGPGLSPFMEKDAQKDPKAKLGKAFMALIGHTNEDEVMKLLEELLAEAVVHGKGSQTAAELFDHIFKGDAMAPFKLAVEVVNHNYSNFFDEVASVLESDPEMMGKPA
jgi:hypothetical protein